MTGTPPPHDLQAEDAVLSAVLVDPEALDNIVDILPNYQAFYSGKNQVVYAAALQCKTNHEPVDVVQVASQLQAMGKLQHVGGKGYLADLLSGSPAVRNVRAHAQTVLDRYRARQVILACQRIAAAGYGAMPEGGVQVYADDAAQTLATLATGASQDTLVPLAVPMKEALAMQQAAAAGGRRTVGVSTGYDQLDQLMGGWGPGELTVIGARPGRGKTAAAIGCGVQVARQNAAVVIFSLEMPRDQLAYRQICTEARVDLNSWRTGALCPADWDRIGTTNLTLAHLPIWVDDKPGLTVLEMRSKVRRVQAIEAKQGRQVGLVIVDYLQLMRGTQLAIKQGREREVSEIAQDLKETAKLLKVSVLALSQLNRAIEQRAADGKDARPQLSDLRESGNIEQAADRVAFLHEVSPNETDWLFDKQRNGPKGVVRFKWEPAFTKFSQAPGVET